MKNTCKSISFGAVQLVKCTDEKVLEQFKNSICSVNYFSVGDYGHFRDGDKECYISCPTEISEEGSLVTVKSKKETYVFQKHRLLWMF